MYFWKVYGALEEIPYGYVITYGNLEKMIGYSKNSRKVNNALKYIERYGAFPCHRAVHNDGSLAPYFDQQYDLLVSDKLQSKIIR